MAVAFQLPTVHPFDGNGTPYPGAMLYFYAPGGAFTHRTVFADVAGLVVHPQPVVADSAGRFPPIYCQTGNYYVVLKDQDGATIAAYDFDPGPSATSYPLAVTAGGTGATNAAQARTNLGAAAQTAMTSVQTSIATIQSQIDASLTDSDTRLGLLAGRDTVRTVDLDDTDFGHVVRNRSITSIVGPVTTTATIPYDSTIPQSGEGSELFSVNFTPKSALSTIRIEAVLSVNTNNAVTIFALFDGGANALQVAATQGASATMQHVTLLHEMPSWTGAKTISIRWGSNSGTSTLNQFPGPVTFGGVIASYLTIQEVQGGPF